MSTVRTISILSFCLSFALANDICRAQAGAEEKPAAATEAEQYLIEGDALLNQKIYSLAIKSFAEATRLDPGNARAWFKLGLAYAASGELAVAIAKWKRVLEIDPGNEIARRNIEKAEQELAKKAASAPPPGTEAAPPPETEKVPPPETPPAETQPPPPPPPPPGAGLRYLGLVGAEKLSAPPEIVAGLEPELELSARRVAPPADATAFIVQLLALTLRPSVCPPIGQSGCQPNSASIEISLDAALLYTKEAKTAKGEAFQAPVKVVRPAAPLVVKESAPLPAPPALPGLESTEAEQKAYVDALAAYNQRVAETQNELQRMSLLRAAAALVEGWQKSATAASAWGAPAAAPECPKCPEPVVVQKQLATGAAVNYGDPEIAEHKTLNGFGTKFDLNLSLNYQTDLTLSGSSDFYLKDRFASEHFSFSTDIELDGDFSVDQNGDASGSFSAKGDGGPYRNYARMTADAYLVSDLFLFAEPQLNTDLNFGSGTSNEAPSVAIFAGVGWGRVLPVATYARVIDYLNVLHRHNLLKRRLTVDEIRHLMGILSNRWDGAQQCSHALQELKRMDLLVAEPDDFVKLELIEAIEKSYGYKDLGKDIRIGVRYIITSGTLQIIAPLEIALLWQHKIVLGKWTLEPLAGAYFSTDPFLATMLAGGIISYQPSPRSKYSIMEVFGAAVNEADSNVYNLAMAEYRYWITNLITVSLQASVMYFSGTDPVLNLTFNIGLATY